MSLNPETSFEQELRNNLESAGLTLDIIGRRFRFGCIHGSHHQILVGTIEALRISDEGGFELQVSNRLFWGTSLLGIYWNPDNCNWTARVDAEDPNFRYFPGDLRVL